MSKTSISTTSNQKRAEGDWYLLWGTAEKPCECERYIAIQTKLERGCDRGLMSIFVVCVHKHKT